MLILGSRFWWVGGLVMPAPLSGDLRERIVAAIRWEFDARGSRAVFGEPIFGI
jgi:hypothetical protein